MVIFLRKVIQYHEIVLVWHVWLLRRCRTEEYDSLEGYLTYLLFFGFCGDLIDRISKMTV
jgi:phosphate starvation-inducible membrane PsiE